jgi:TPP-dependent indolepyruvate ferredoxin oxidoreductase alpha subunit
MAGDDHACQSSSIPNSSDQVLVAAMIPVLNPASLQDYLDLGLFGFALSRYSGCWVGFKAVGQTVESSASILVEHDRSRFVLPEDLVISAGGLGEQLSRPSRWPSRSRSSYRAAMPSTVWIVLSPLCSIHSSARLLP